ncbi:MAG: hypothetical protein FWC80_04705 [Firmicutes bacterium]|nr:hypothetical protein [Bacillota bacterium]
MDNFDMADVIVNMYPDIYKRVLPFVDEAMETYGDGRELDDYALQSMTNHIIARADFHNHPHHGYSDRAVRDIVRALLLSRFIGGCGRNCGHRCGSRCDFDFPFFPFWWGRGGYRGSFGGGRGHGRGGHRGGGRGGHSSRGGGSRGSGRGRR